LILDVAVLFLLVIALIIGYQRGVIQPLMAEIFFFGTLLVVFRFHDQYTSQMEKLLHLTPVLSIFLAIILAIIMGAVGGAIGGAFHRLESIRGIDGLLGIFVHVAVTLVVVYLAISALVVLDNAFDPALRTASLSLAQVNTLESWVESNPITAAMVSKQDLKSLKDAAATAAGAQLQNVAGIHQLQQIFSTFLQPQLHSSRSVPIILSIGRHLPFIGHVGPSDLHPAVTPLPSPNPSPTTSPKHSPSPKASPKPTPKKSP
jgi:uncharacterized membrane protein required for colicin V production